MEIAGTGIAEVAALADVDVRLLDVSRERLEQALERIDGHLLGAWTRACSPRRSVRRRSRIRTSTDYDSFRDCQLVIEAATEDEAIKRIFKTLIGYLPDDAVVARWSRSRPGGGDRPARALHRHALLEPGAGDELSREKVIRGIITDETTFQAIRDVVERFGARRRSPPRTSRRSSSTASCCR